MSETCKPIGQASLLPIHRMRKRTQAARAKLAADQNRLTAGLLNGLLRGL
jgi:hypothetical protein